MFPSSASFAEAASVTDASSSKDEPSAGDRMVHHRSGIRWWRRWTSSRAAFKRPQVSHGVPDGGSAADAGGLQVHGKRCQMSRKRNGLSLCRRVFIQHEILRRQCRAVRPKEVRGLADDRTVVHNGDSRIVSRILHIGVSIRLGENRQWRGVEQIGS